MGGLRGGDDDGTWDSRTVRDLRVWLRESLRRLEYREAAEEQSRAQLQHVLPVKAGTSAEEDALAKTIAQCRMVLLELFDEDLSEDDDSSGHRAPELDKDSGPEREAQEEIKAEESLDEEAKASETAERIAKVAAATERKPGELISAAHLDEERLEAGVVDVYLAFVTLLSHPSREVWEGALCGLVGLTSIMDRRFVPNKALGRAIECLSGGQDPNQTASASAAASHYAGVAALVNASGTSLRGLAPQIVGSLESLFAHPNDDVCKLGIAFASGIACRNPDAMDIIDLSRLCWAFFMELNTSDGGSQHVDSASATFYVQRSHLQSHKRKVALQALEQMLPLVLHNDLALGKEIFNVLIAKAPTTVFEWSAAHASFKHMAPILISNKLEDFMFSQVASQLCGQHKAIPRQFYAMVRVVAAASPQNVSSRAAVERMLNMIERYILAPRVQLRYGALLVVHAVAVAIPAEILRLEESTLFPLLVSECLDHNQSCLMLSLSCLKAVLSHRKRGGAHKLDPKELQLENLRKRIAEQVTQVEHVVSTGKGCMGNVQQTLVWRLVTRALPLCSGFEEKQLLRLSNGIRYLPVNERLHRIQVILLWTPHIFKLIPDFVRNLIGCLRDPNPAVVKQMARVLAAFGPGLDRALRERDARQPLEHDIYYRTVALLDVALRKALTSAARSGEDDSFFTLLDALVTLPLEFFSEARLVSLVQLFLNAVLESRRAANRIKLFRTIGQCSTIFRSPDLQLHAVAVLMCSLGERSPFGVAAVLKAITAVLGTEPHPALLELSYIAQGQAKALDSGDLDLRLKSYEVIAIAVAHPRLDAFRSLFDTDGYLGAAVACVRGKIEADLSAGKLTADSEHLLPFCFLFIIRTKLAFTGGAAFERMEEMREELCALLKGLMKSPDQLVSHLAIRTAFHCLISSDGRVHTALLQRFVSQLFDSMFDSSQADQGLAAALLKLMRLVIPLSATPLNRTLLVYFLPEVLSRLERTEVSFAFRIEGLRFVQAVLGARPQGARGFLETIRDVVRATFLSTRPEPREVASQMYPQLVALGSGSADGAEDFFDYLVADLASLREDQDTDANDPMLSNLSDRQLAAVHCATLRGLGEVRHPQMASRVIDVLFEVVHHRDVELRKETVRALLRLSGRLEEEHCSAVRWVVLPMLADPNREIRDLFQDPTLMNLDSACEETHRTDLDDCDEDANALFTSLAKEALLGDELFRLTEDQSNEQAAAIHDASLSSIEAAIAAAAAFLASGLPAVPATTLAGKESSTTRDGRRRSSVNQDRRKSRLNSQAQDSGELEQASRVNISASFGSCDISQALMRRMKAHAVAACGNLEPSHIDLVEYQFNTLIGNNGLKGPVSLALALLGEQIVRICAKHKEQGRPDTIWREKLTGILTSFVLTFQLEDGSATRDLIHASALGLRHLAKHDPEATIPFLFDQFSRVSRLRFGQMTSLKFAIEAVPKRGRSSTLATLVSTEQAKVLTGLLLNIVTSKAIAMEDKKAALDLIGPVASQAGSQELTSVIKSIIAILEESSDASIHAMSQQQLSKMFASLEPSHPLVQSLIEHVNVGLLSCEEKKRLRSFTLLLIVNKTMGPAQAIPGYIRALADPSKRLRELAIQTLLKSPPEIVKSDSFFSAGMRQIANQLELEQASQNRDGRARSPSLKVRGASSALKIETISSAPVHGVRGQSATGEGHGGGGSNEAMEAGSGANVTRALVYPLPDEDPLNMTFLNSSLEYKSILDEYGMSRSRLVRVSGGMSGNQDEEEEEDDGENEDGKGLQEYAFGLTHKAFATFLKADPVPIIQLLLRVEASVGQVLVDAIDEDAQHALELLRASEATLLELDRNAQSMMQSFGVGEIELEQLVHNFKVYMKILAACEGLPDTWTALLPKYQDLVKTCAECGRLLRTVSTRKMNEITMMSMTDSFDLAFISVDHFEMYEKKRADFFASVEHSRHDESKHFTRGSLLRELDKLNSQLWMMSQMQHIFLSTLGLLYADAKSLDKSVVVEGFEWLMEQLTSDPNRSLRCTSRDAIVRMTQANRKEDEFKRTITDTVGHFRKQLEHNLPSTSSSNPDAQLFRAKVDLMFALVHIIASCGAPSKVLTDLVSVLVSFWDDPDSVVRKNAIQLVETLGSSGLSDLKFVLFDPATIDIRAEINKHVSDPDCAEKDLLNRLLQWSHQAFPNH